MTTYSSSLTWGKVKDSYDEFRENGLLDSNGLLFGMTEAEIQDQDDNGLVFEPLVLTEEELANADRLLTEAPNKPEEETPNV
jgi:hypothetical protein